MSEPLRIPVQQLRTAFELLIQRIADDEGETISLQRDYFWSIAPDVLYNPYAEPGEPGLGQLSESWQHLEDLLKDESLAMPHHLAWLADLLRALGHPQTRTPLT
ncbi:hypothetical protein [Amycolatopsis panacis]|uniref:Uncharacterized protein n=1 Tax=Amycolatopsis panacis TaxID=2340917 RepID=A0A419IBK8_9PSEU|nr:hypothetical protein [Amycolatopsis panacis]RJQ91854.1 hypothetical protein D5S19_01465 [Amycolatopsis panacis]